MEKINAINLPRLSNANHVQYHNAVLTNITQHGAAALGLDATIVAQYKNALALEQDMVQRALGSEYTMRLEAYDAQRDGLYELIICLLEGAQFYPNAAVTALYPTIKTQLLDRYPRSVKWEKGQTETSKIRGLLVDLAKLNQETLTTLGVTPLVTAIKAANDGFEQAYLARNSERQETGLDVMKNLRADTDRVYQLLRVAIDYLANVTGTDEDAADRQQAALTLVRETNQHVAYYKRFYLSSRKGTESAEETEDGQETDEPENDGRSEDAGTPDNPGSSASQPTDVVEVTEP